MTELIGKYKVYSEFLTNLAVAWFAAGIISQLFAKSKDPTQTVLSVVFGALGAWVSLDNAIYWDKRGRQ